MYHVLGIMYYAKYKHSVLRVLILCVFWCHTETLICCSGEAIIVSWTMCMYVIYVVKSIEYNMYHIPSTCAMYYVLCIMYTASCSRYYVLCNMHWVSGVINYVLCNRYYVPCIKYCALCNMPYV